jgi:hypothetical protein
VWFSVQNDRPKEQKRLFILRCNNTRTRKFVLAGLIGRFSLMVADGHQLNSLQNRRWQSVKFFARSPRATKTFLVRPPVDSEHFFSSFLTLFIVLPINFADELAHFPLSLSSESEYFPSLPPIDFGEVSSKFVDGLDNVSFISSDGFRSFFHLLRWDGLRRTLC